MKRAIFWVLFLAAFSVLMVVSHTSDLRRCVEHGGQDFGPYGIGLCHAKNGAVVHY